jgi:hypothetical protein
MNIVILALIGLVLLAGLATIGRGHRGWSVGTIVAAVLLLLAATGYIYLAARMVERERAWRQLVTNNLKAIKNLREGSRPEESLAALKDKRVRWQRALSFVDTWHGRFWENVTFSPPSAGAGGTFEPGTLAINKPSNESQETPVDAGAEVAVFAGKGDEGVFLGLFRVKRASANEGAEKATLTIEPASSPDPPSAADAALWTHDYENVTVYESLPVDRWLTFHRTPTDAAPAAGEGEGEGEGEDESSAASGGAHPARKTAAGDLLEGLEQQMKELSQHGEDVPETDWKTVAGDLAAGKNGRLPGSYWAVVEFTENVRYTKDNKFALDERGAAEAAPAEAPAGGDDDDEGPGPAPDAPPEVEGDEEKPLGTGANVASHAAVISKRFKALSFEKGETAEFDLQTAMELQDDNQWVRIKRVLFRRPLADPYTALRGGEFEVPGADGKPVPVRSQGIDALRRILLAEIKGLDESIARTESARASIQAQATSTTDETNLLTKDLESWERDIKVATATAAAFDDRLRAATLELAAVETSIARLGQELTGAVASLSAKIDGVAPPPERQPR